jgi:GT2 family glycosyltransferase
MAAFKNITNIPVKIMLNGERKTINPGQVIHGPDSLSAIPGLQMANKQARTVILNQKSNNTLDTTIKLNEPIKIPESELQTDYSQQINQTITYLNYYKNIGRSPSVSIAILTKNSLHLIKACCDSIIQKVKYPNTTIMICDTGSDQKNVYDYYETVKQSCEQKGFQYKLIQLRHYQYSENYNEISKHVDTDFFLLQNNDTVALNDYISEMMEIAVFSNVGSVGCRMLYPDGRIQHDGQHIFQPNGQHVPGTAGHLHLGARPEQINPKEPKIKIVDGNTAAGCLMRTSDYRKLNGLDVNYKDIFQDVDIMIRIPNILNTFNYCNRNALIIHHDNASRMGTMRDPKRLQQMRDDTYYLKHKCDSNGWQRKNPKQVDFSIITLVHNYDSYKDLLNTLRIQQGNFSIELIAIPNFYNQFNNMYKTLNNAIDVSNGRYLMFIHDDVLVSKDFLSSIVNNIRTFNKNGIGWGVLGPAGIFMDAAESAFYLLDKDNKILSASNNIAKNKQFHEVTSLDELCLIIDKQSGLRFSSNLCGFHFYGADICLSAKIQGFSNFAINAYCHHKSDGSKNLSDSKQFEAYRNQAFAFHKHAKLLGQKKWRSTTARGIDNNVIIFAVPEYLKKETGKDVLIYQL